MNDQIFLEAAIEEARKGLEEGGIPIGSVLVKDNIIIGRGHNQRIQQGSAVLHAEIHALESAGRLSAKDYQKTVLYTTLSPCAMCSGAILLYKISKVIIGENKTFMGEEKLLRDRNVETVILNNRICIEMMEKFIKENPTLWNEDIGEDA